MPSLKFLSRVGSLTEWFADNEFSIYKKFIQEHVKDQPAEVTDPWLDDLMMGGKQQEFEVWLQQHYPDELEMYNIVRYK